MGGDELASDLRDALGEVGLEVGLDGGAKVVVAPVEGEADEGGDEAEPAEQAEVEGAVEGHGGNGRRAGEET